MIVATKTRIYSNKITILPGFEPGIFCSVGRRVIRCATGPAAPIPGHLADTLSAGTQKWIIVMNRLLIVSPHLHSKLSFLRFKLPHRSLFSSAVEHWSCIIARVNQGSGVQSSQEASQCIFYHFYVYQKLKYDISYEMKNEISEWLRDGCLSLVHCTRQLAFHPRRRW